MHYCRGEGTRSQTVPDFEKREAADGNGCEPRDVALGCAAMLPALSASGRALPRIMKATTRSPCMS